MKEQLKIQNKTIINGSSISTPQKGITGPQQLTTLNKKYYLPYDIQL